MASNLRNALKNYGIPPETLCVWPCKSVFAKEHAFGQTTTLPYRNASER